MASVIPSTTGGGFGPQSLLDQFDHAFALWAPPVRTPDAEIIPTKPRMDARSRDLARSDSYVQSGLNLRQDNIVGAMYLLNSKPNTKYLFGAEDDVWEKEFQEEIETLFTMWAESENRWVDAARINDFTAWVRLMVIIHGLGGEAVATAEWLRDLPRPCSTAVQTVANERLSNPMGEMESPRLRGGVEKNRFGAPQAYHFRMAHPADHSAMADQFRWKRVPATKPWGRRQVLHIYDQFQPEQTRGFSDFVTALMETKIAKKFRKITLENAVVNATYAASIESELPADIVYQSLGSGNVNAAALMAYAAAYLGAAQHYANSSRNMNINGVRIPHLFPGTKLQLRPAGTPGGVGTDFEASLLRYLAAAAGVSYEEISRDYSKTNYASAKAGEKNTFKFMQARKKSVADRAANFVFRLWFEEMVNAGQITTFRSKAPIYDNGMLNMNFEAYTGAEWIGAGRGQIDELKETQAAVLRVKNNLSTLEDELARNGRDWRKTLKQREREMREQEDRQIMPAEDQNMLNAVTGEPSDGGDRPDGEGDKSGGDARVDGIEARLAFLEAERMREHA